MKIHRTLFKAIDILGDAANNPDLKRKYDKKRGVELKSVLNRRYSDRSDMCFADYYYYKRPENEKYPVVIYIHGGGFVAGDKSFRRAMAAWLSNLGFFVININYSLCENERFPVPILECVDALNHISAIAEEYNLDTDNIIVGGDSAGAYYACALSAIVSNKAYANSLNALPRLKIKAAFFNCGLYDLDTAMSKKTPLDLCTRICMDYTGYRPEELKKLDVFHLISPINFVTDEFPVSFVIYAKHDIFCLGQSPMLIEKLKKNGVRYQEYCASSPLNNHCYSLSWRGRESRNTLKCLKNFLISIL